MPILDEELSEFTKKQFAPETNKKIRWVTKMFYEWRRVRNSLADRAHIQADLDDASTLTIDIFVFSQYHFVAEIKKIDGSEFPPCTLYQIVICVQFQLEKLGLNFKLLDDIHFVDLCYALDNEDAMSAGY